MNFKEIVSVLPHDPPMVFIDSVDDYDLIKRTITTAFLVSKDSIFYDKAINGVPAWAGIEYMAQSLGVLDGLSEKNKGLPPQIGFLLGSRSYVMHAPLFELGEKYQVQVQENFSDNEIGNYNCQITNAGKLYAEAEITVYKTSDPMSLIEGK